jgi:hypothetical protein
MKFAIICSITISASAEDLCARLCILDGPSICTEGSWTKNGDICHRYLFKGDPTNLDYCYHTLETKDSCPSTGVPLRVSDVNGIIALRFARGTTTEEPEIITPYPASLFLQSLQTLPTYEGIMAGHIAKVDGGVWFQISFSITVTEAPAYNRDTGSSNIAISLTVRNEAGVEVKMSQTSEDEPIFLSEHYLLMGAFVSDESTGLTRFIDRVNKRVGGQLGIKDVSIDASIGNLYLSIFGISVPLSLKDSQVVPSSTSTQAPSSVADHIHVMRASIARFYANRDLDDVHLSTTAFATLIEAVHLTEDLNDSDKAAFVSGSEISDFCLDQMQRLRDMIRLRHKERWSGPSGEPGMEYAFLKDMDSLCPQLLEGQTDLQAIAVRHRVYAHRRRVGDVYAMSLLRQYGGLYEPRGELTDAHWLRNIGERIFDPAVGFFDLNDLGPARKFYGISSAGIQDTENFKAVGEFFALMFIQGEGLETLPPDLFFALMFGEPVPMQVLLDTNHSSTFEALTSVMNATSNAELEALPIVLDGRPVIASLVNRVAIVEQKIRETLIPSDVIPLFEAIKSAFFGILPRRLFKGLLTSAQLRQTILSLPEVNIDDLIGSIKLIGAHRMEVDWFFQALRSLSQAQLKTFLRRVTHSFRIPVEGFVNQQPRIQLTLLTVTTVPKIFNEPFNIISLPLYPAYEVLHASLLQFIHEA